MAHPGGYPGRNVPKLLGSGEYPVFVQICVSGYRFGERCEA